MSAAIQDGTPRLIAVAGAKGGVGKSLLAANFGIFLATLGKRVVVIDGALGCANLHMFTGVRRPKRTLTEVLGDASMNELVEPTPVPGLHLVAGVRDPAWAAALKPAQARRIMDELRSLDADMVIIDLNAGTGSHTLDWFLHCDIGVLVTGPEPTSVEVCYRFMRTAFARKLSQEGLSRAAQRLTDSLPNVASGIAAPLDLYQQARAVDPSLAEMLEAEILQIRPHLVVNSTRSKADMELGRAVASAARRRLGVPVIYLGHLEYDEAVWAAIRRRRPLLVEHPESRVSKCIEKVTRRLLAARDADRVETEIGAASTHYELLEVEPTASFEEIRRANRRIHELYGRESVVISGLFTDEQLVSLHQQFEEAYTTLMDAATRKAYDLELFPDGLPAQALEQSVTTAKVEIPPAERPPMPDISGNTEFSGALLQQIREAVGIDLREIAERTKIGMGYLQAIESERFHKLPAPVYVRGFLVEYAKILGLDGDRVVETFLARYRSARTRNESDGNQGN